MYIYDKYIFNGFWNQLVPSNKFKTKKECKKSRDCNLMAGINCGEIKKLTTHNSHRCTKFAN